jgi:hypothetical protein
MEEYVTWILGFLLGMGYPRPFNTRARAIPFVILVAVLGAGVTVLSGEWALQPGFALVDIGQIGLTASIAAFARPHIASQCAMLLARSRAR